ncbi:methionine ABC transporter permease [Vagococcus vulneris]|uniref:Methionine ABC transporter permease n=1 Tax=Vagococcus vulneris TaxID=1977869 RepID=A0A429ZZ63_9ENTE|nr:methionine ABC transporter permease [Vagococcus vulneris]RST99284.1 methionine ABC transporter permease [Vagococcus vulneris]
MNAETLSILQENLPKALFDTFYMVAISTIVGVLFGTFIGLGLYLINHPLFSRNPIIYRISGFLVNALRSLPFLILLVVLIPLLTLLLGDPYTPTGGAIALSIISIPFYARLAEGSFADIPNGVIESAVASGAKISLIIHEVIIPESLPALIRGTVLTIISLLGYSAMVGTIGAGGIGDLAIQYGYYRYETVILIIVIMILVILVQLIQWIGDILADYYTK